MPATKNVIGSNVEEGFPPPAGLVVPLVLGPEVVVDVWVLPGPELPEEPEPDGGEVPVGGVEPEGGLTGGLLAIVVTLVATKVS